MSLLSGIPILGGLLEKVIEKVSPDKSATRQQQAEINAREVEGAPPSVFRLWRSFLGFLLTICFAWEVVGRSVILTYWPDVKLPPSVLKEISTLLLGMLGLGF